MRFTRRLVAVCALLAAAPAAIAIAIHLLVPRWLAPTLAASVKAETGRELGFGEAAVMLWPRPPLVLSQLRFGNASWRSQPWMAQVGRAAAEFDALALLSGRLRIMQISVANASVLVETARSTAMRAWRWARCVCTTSPSISAAGSLGAF